MTRIRNFLQESDVESDQYGIVFNIFDKMAAGAHFGCPKFTFDRISGHFRSIRNFNFCLKV